MSTDQYFAHIWQILLSRLAAIFRYMMTCAKYLGGVELGANLPTSRNSCSTGSAGMIEPDC
jgi:hypothetical protein